MKENKLYQLPNLPYGYNELEPYISEEQLKIHYQKHHRAYVDGANKILEDIDNADLKKLAFQIGGYKLHSLFWDNLMPSGGGEPTGKLAEQIEKDFGSFESFKEKFNKTALSIEGSGWVALAYDKEIDRFLIMQIEKHNVNIYPTVEILMVLDMFEHAYYIDYKNEKGKYVDVFWSLVNWDKVNERCGCKGVSDKPGVCQVEDCSNHDHQLEECGCVDEKHYGAFEETGDQPKD